MSEVPRTFPEAPVQDAADPRESRGEGLDAFPRAVPVNLSAQPNNSEPDSDQSDSEAPDSEEITELQPQWRADVPAEEESGGEATEETVAAPSSPWSPPLPDAPVGVSAVGEEAQADGGSEPPVPPCTPEEQHTGGEEKPMSLLEHLGELRTRLVRMLIGALVGFFLCYGISEQLFQWLSMPLSAVMPQDTRLIYTSVPEGFFVYLQVAFVAGVFLASPYIFYQIWAFVAPGLYREERRQVIPLALCSAIFFIMGAAFCYFAVFPVAFAFFMSYSTGMIVAMPSISEYLGFSLKMLLAFGLIFEMPLFAFFLSRMGLITATWMRKVRRYAVLVVFVVAAVLTPPDVFSQTLMAIPMLLLYEVSIFVAAGAGRKEKPDSAAVAGNKQKERA